MTILFCYPIAYSYTYDTMISADDVKVAMPTPLCFSKINSLSNRLMIARKTPLAARLRRTRFSILYIISSVTILRMLGTFADKLIVRS